MHTLNEEAERGQGVVDLLAGNVGGLRAQERIRRERPAKYAREKTKIVERIGSLDSVAAQLKTNVDAVSRTGTHSSTRRSRPPTTNNFMIPLLCSLVYSTTHAGWMQTTHNTSLDPLLSFLTSVVFLFLVILSTSSKPLKIYQELGLLQAVWEQWTLQVQKSSPLQVVDVG